MAILVGIIDGLGPFWTIFVVSLVLSVIITFIYKWMTDQKEMKRLKEKTKELQKEIRKNRDNPKKMMQINKEAMQVNTQYMMKSLRPTLVTFLPILLIFGWLSTTLAYYPISPGENFSVSAAFKEANMQTIRVISPDGIKTVGSDNQTVMDGKAKWDFVAERKGNYMLTFVYQGKQYYQKIKVSDTWGEYESPDQRISDSSLKSLKTNLEKIRPLGNFSIFGWRLDWIWTYIILSMIFSLGLRKIMKLY